MLVENNKFKVGDRVLCFDEFQYCEGVVIEIDDFGDYLVESRNIVGEDAGKNLLTGLNTWWFAEDCIRGI